MDSRERTVPELQDGPITVLSVDDDRQPAETVVAYLERIDDRLDDHVEPTAAAGLDRQSLLFRVSSRFTRRQ